MGFVNRMDQNAAKYSITFQIKNGGGLRLLEWSVFFFRNRINKDEGDEIAFWRDSVNVIFPKYSMEGRSSLSRVGIRSVPSDVYYDDKKHYQVPSVWKIRQV